MFSKKKILKYSKSFKDDVKKNNELRRSLSLNDKSKQFYNELKMAVETRANKTKVPNRSSTRIDVLETEHTNEYAPLAKPNKQNITYETINNENNKDDEKHSLNAEMSVESNERNSHLHIFENSENGKLLHHKPIVKAGILKKQPLIEHHENNSYTTNPIILEQSPPNQIDQPNNLEDNSRLKQLFEMKHEFLSRAPSNPYENLTKNYVNNEKPKLEHETLPIFKEDKVNLKLDKPSKKLHRNEYRVVNDFGDVTNKLKRREAKYENKNKFAYRKSLHDSKILDPEQDSEQDSDTEMYTLDKKKSLSCNNLLSGDQLLVSQLCNQFEHLSKGKDNTFVNTSPHQTKDNAKIGNDLIQEYKKIISKDKSKLVPSKIFKRKESNFQKPQEEVVQQNLYDNINLRNSKLRFSDRKSVKSANIIIDNVKLLRTEEHPLPESELVIKKEGALEQVKLIIENKKCKRWSNSYVLLTNHALFVFKDKQDVDKMKSGAKGHYDHVKLDLKSCTTKVENHPKKSVFVVSNEVQTQVHIQHDMLSWKTLIEEVISSLTPNINNSSSVEDLNRSGSIKEQTKIKIKLKNFFSGPRTPVEVLTKRGIYRDEPIFASSLETLCSQQPRPKVPEFVKKCIKAIEPHLDTDGLYRASGNLSQVQKIRLQVDQNDFSNVNVEKTDIHVLTGALKLFFRELQTPLIPNDKYDKCIEACNKEKTKQANALSSVVNRLPSSHRDTLQYLIGHLIDVSKHEASNRMDISNVATVWAPNILQGTMNNVKQDMLYHCSMQMRVVEIMLTNYASVFGCKKEDFDKNFVSK